MTKPLSGSREDEGARPRLPLATLWITSLAVFAVMLDSTTLFVAFPDVVASFADVDPATVSWVLNGFTIVFAALLVPFGLLADRYGHRRAFLVGSVVFTLAAVACALAPTVPTLVAARVVQAAGAAVLVPASLALLLRATPRSLVPMAIALWGATGAAAAAAGPTLGALVIQVGGWRAVFLLHLPVGAVTVWLGRRVLLEARRPETALPSPVGVVLLLAGATAVTLGLVRGGAWAPGRTLAVVAAGLAALGLLVVHQRRTRAPVVDPALFAVRNFRWGNIATLAFGTAFAAMFLSSILFLTEVWGWSVLAAGLGVAPGPLLVGVLVPLVGRWAVRVGQRPLLLAGGVVYAAGGWLRVLMLDGEVAYLRDFLPSMALTGLGVALCLPQLASVVAQALPPDRLGMGGAVNQAVRQLGMTLGVALAVGLIAEPTGLLDAVARFDRVWWVIVAGGLATSLLVLPLRTDPAGG